MHFSTTLRAFCAFIFTLLLTALFSHFGPQTSPAFGQSVPDDVVAPIDAEVAFYTRYRAQKNHKAIAFGQGGLWYMSYGQPNQKAAAERALQGCQNNQRKSPYQAARGRPCHLFS